MRRDWAAFETIQQQHFTKSTAILAKIKNIMPITSTYARVVKN